MAHYLLIKYDLLSTFEHERKMQFNRINKYLEKVSSWEFVHGSTANISISAAK